MGRGGGDAGVADGGGGGGGDKAVTGGLDGAFLAVVADHTAGDPMRAEVRWTNLGVGALSRRLGVGRRAVRRLLRRHGFRRRRATKDRAMGNRPGRDEQFRRIAELKAEHRAAGEPVVSIDTKKRELVGNFARPGTVLADGPVRTFDHDFPTFAAGVVIPHGVYDPARNAGHLTLGTSHDTTEFACDSLRRWWARQGRAAYPGAKRLLVLCDGGGSNSATRRTWKADLAALADDLGLEIRVAHYPPYCSKYNPADHRLFPHVARACAGVVFHTVEVAKRFMERTSTAAGLWVTVDVMDRAYQTGRKLTAAAVRQLRILYDEALPQWNYRAVPASLWKTGS